MTLNEHREHIESAERSLLPTDNESLLLMETCLRGEASRICNALWYENTRPVANELAARFEALADKAAGKLREQENASYAAWQAAR